MKNKSLFRALGRSCALLLKLAPLALIIKISASLISGVIGGFLAPANEYLFQTAEDALGGGSVSKIYIAAALMIGTLLASALFGTIGNYVSGRASLDIQFELRSDFYKKIGKVKPILFEDSAFIEKEDKISLSCYFVDQLVFAWADILINLGSYVTVMAVYLCNLDPLLIFVLILTFIPTMVVSWLKPRLTEKIKDKSRHYSMLADKYSEHAGDPYDTRLFGAFHYFDKLYCDNKQTEYKIAYRYNLQIRAIEFGCTFVKIVGWIGILLLLLRSLRNGTITTGAFTAVFTSVEVMFAKFEGFFKNYLENALNYNMVNTYFDFRDRPTQEEGDKNVPDFDKDGIIVQNITFKYPEAEENVIKNVSLEIKPGETLAIVGENGSGKTTLSKLLCGLYAPDSGMVSVGGQDTQTTAFSALMSKTSAVFQNYICYDAMTLRDNIRISGQDKNGDVISALEKSMVDYGDEKTFPNGIDTMMGRMFDGAEISGGQWQRIAIARGLYRDHEMILLDEPTSAIDPLEETRLYKQFADLSKGKTSILITHRLGSVAIADRIIVMDHGMIAESGTHEELLKLNGKYAQMWYAQADSYVKD